MDPPPLSLKTAHRERANTLQSYPPQVSPSPCLSLAFCCVGISVLGATHQLAAGSCNVNDSPPHSQGPPCPPSHRCRCCHLPLLSLLVLKAPSRLQTTHPELCPGLAEASSSSLGAGPTSVCPGGGGGGRRLAVLVPQGETAVVRCAGREGGEERERYRELFIPSL